MAGQDLDAVYRELTNTQKAALLLIALGQRWATEILRLLKEEEVKALSYWINQMSFVPQELTERVVKEFYARLVRKASLSSSGGREYLRDVLVSIMGEGKAQELLESLEDHKKQEVLNILRKVNPKQLAAYLKQERPQTIALMMSYLEPPKAAEIIGALPEESQTEIIMCMAKMEESDPDVVFAIEQALSESLGPLAVGGDSKKVGGLKSVAEILNSVDKEAGKVIMDQITERDFDLAAAIKDLMFTFDDLTLLDDKSMQSVLKDVDQNDLILALKGATEGIKDKVFRNMSKRQAESINDELSFLGPVKASVVAQGQSKIVSVIRKLDEEGKILIQGKGGGGDDIIA